MNKAELVAAVAEKTGLSKKDSQAALEAVLLTIEESLVSNEKVVLPGFGSFELRHREARMGFNPSKGEPVPIPAQNAVGFKVGKALKEAVNK